MSGRVRNGGEGLTETSAGSYALCQAQKFNMVFLKSVLAI